MASPPSPGRRPRYPSPLIKQDLAKLGKDGESRRAALVSLRSVVEDHLDAASLPRFLTQIEDSREGRRHVAPLLEDLARIHGPRLSPHIPRLLHLLVHSLLATTCCPPLLTACASAVASMARFCAGDAPEEILRQVCLPLLALLPNKIPPLSTGAAICLRALVDSEQWRFAPASLVDDICWKAAMAAAAPPTQTVAHIHLLRALATSDASAISKFAPPLLRLSLDILLNPAATTSWQLRLSAVHLLESLLKAADYRTLAAHLHPSLTALAKCCRHDKLPQVRKAVLQALQIAEALQKQQTKHSIKLEPAIAKHRRQRSDPFSNNTQVALPSQISPSPLTSPRRLNSLSARAAPAHGSPPGADYYFPYFNDADESAPSRKIVHHIQDLHSNSERGAQPLAKPSPRMNTRKPAPVRNVTVPSFHLPGRQSYGNSITEIHERRAIESSKHDNPVLHSARDNAGFLPEIDECAASTMSSSATREIMVLNSNNELLASCERSLLASKDSDNLSCERKVSLAGQFTEAKFEEDDGLMGTAFSPKIKDPQVVKIEERRRQDSLNPVLAIEGDASAASVHLFNSLAQLATVEKCEQRSFLPGAKTDQLSNESTVSSPFPPAKFQISATNQCHNPSEHTDAEAETTSSGEWSVRDNPIAKDHAEDMAKHSNINPWPCNIAASLPEEAEEGWVRSSMELEKGLESQNKEMRAQEPGKEALQGLVSKSDCVHEQGSSSHGYVSEEFWTEIEEMTAQTASPRHRWKPAEPYKPSKAYSRLHFKLLLCVGVLVSITMTVLTREMQHQAAAQYLPPT